jgi:hypothetical protein
VLDELMAEGLAPLAFILTDKLDGSGWSVSEAKQWMDGHLPVWKDSAVSFAMAWEIDQIAGLRPESVQLDLMHHARELLGNSAILWDHRQPGWWGPGETQDGRNEWDYWQSTPCNGLLGQQRLNQAWADSKFEWFESNWAGQARGIAGRLTQHLGKLCAMFEFARTDSAWTTRKAQYQAHRDASWLSGYC